jgi:hypothetical protein
LAFLALPYADDARECGSGSRTSHPRLSLSTRRTLN